MLLKFTLRVRNAKNRNRIIVKHDAAVYQRIKAKAWILPTPNMKHRRGDPQHHSRAYRRIRFRCQQALGIENNLKIKLRKFSFEI